MSRLLSIVLIVSIFYFIPFSSVASDAMLSGQERIKAATEYIKKGGEGNLSKAKKLLRSISIEEQEESIYQAYFMLAEIRDFIRQRYPELTDKDIETAQGSIGKALLDKGRIDEGIEVLIEEAWCFSCPAQIMLELMYQYEIEGYPHKDKRILVFFKASAEEGDFRSLFFLGQIYINGWGVQKDAEKGRKYLEFSQWQERGFEPREGAKLGY